MSDEENWRRFERLALPHLDAAYNLARWLTRNDHDAQDVVQDAVMRAMRYIDGLRAEGARGWLLQIVRNTCYTWLKKNRPAERAVLDEADDAWGDFPAPAADEPPAVALRNADRQQLDAAISALPVAYREVLVLRELEDLPYSDIARIADIPIGTVMSRLARARGLLRVALAPEPRPSPQSVPGHAPGSARS
ncbi:MAG: sigma-70 family RNA polymerase sigma factor [Burkholderiaceae bacterium]